MVAKPARVVLDPKMLPLIEEALAHGLQALGEEIAHDAAGRIRRGTAPDHMADQWGVATWCNGKRVGNASADGSATELTLREGAASNPVGYVGFGGYYSQGSPRGWFSPRYVEFGTSDTPAMPFLTPAAASASSKAASIVAAAAKPYLDKP